MRTTERLRKLKQWISANLCEGRKMKAPGDKMDLRDIRTQVPKCYLAWRPSRTNTAPRSQAEEEQIEISTIPSILIMPNASKARDMEEKRFDRYNGVHRPPELGQTLAVSLLFSVYEPGTRLDGYAKSGEIALLEEGTEQGLFTLYDWMDDCLELLLKEKCVPGTDMYVQDATIAYSLYTDQSFVVDRRPIYYGFVNVIFGCYTNVGDDSTINNILDNE